MATWIDVSLDTGDMETAKGLVHQLSSDFGGDRIMLTEVGDVLNVRVGLESRELVAPASEGIGCWLDQTGTKAQISFGSSGHDTLPTERGA
jgi:hypothetical protein